MTEPIKLIGCIVNRGKGESVVKLCAKENVAFHILLLGRGTADSQTLSLLGIGDKEKDIAFLSVAESRIGELMQKLTDELRLDKPGNGIAFSIPFSAIASQLTSYEILAGNLEHRDMPDITTGAEKIARAVKKKQQKIRNKRQQRRETKQGGDKE